MYNFREISIGGNFSVLPTSFPCPKTESTIVKWFLLGLTWFGLKNLSSFSNPSRQAVSGPIDAAVSTFYLRPFLNLPSCLLSLLVLHSPENTETSSFPSFAANFLHLQRQLSHLCTHFESILDEINPMKEFPWKNSTACAGEIDKEWTSRSVYKVLHTKREEPFQIQNTY